MDMKQLEYFLALAKRENISATASFLNITQSALSKSIAKLEAEVGVSLFDHRGNRIVINDYGRNFAKYASQSLEVLDAGLFSTRQTLHDVMGSIQINCHAFSGILEAPVTDYHFLNPNVQIIVHRHPQKSSAVEDDDFILCSNSDSASFLEKSGAWVAQELFNEEAVLIISEKYRSYPEECQSLSLSSLKDDLFIGMSESSHMYRDITFRLCTAAGFVPRIAFDIDDYLFKVRIVGAGRAIAIVPECCVETAQSLYPDIRAFSIEGMNTRRSIYLARRKRNQMSEAAQDFWEYILDYYQQGPDNRE